MKITPPAMAADVTYQSGNIIARNRVTVNKTYRQVSYIRRIEYQHLKDSRTLLRLSLPNPLKPDVKSRMEM